MSQPGTLEGIVLFFAKVLGPLEHRLAPDQVIETFAELGMRFPPELLAQGSFGSARQNIVDGAVDLPGAAHQLRQALAEDNPAAILSEVLAVGGSIRDLIAGFQGLRSGLEDAAGSLPGLSPVDVNAFATALPDRLFNQLLVDYLDRTVPGVNGSLQLLGVVDRTAAQVGSLDPAKPPYLRIGLKPNRLFRALTDLNGLLRDLYKWGAPGFDGEELLRRLADLLLDNGVPAVFDESSPASVDLFAARLRAAPGEPSGLSLELFGDLEGESITTSDGQLETEIRFEFQIPSGSEVVLRSDGGVTVTPPGGSGPVEGELGARLTGRPSTPEQPFLLFGQPQGTRLEIGELAAEGVLTLRWNAPKATGDITLEGALNEGKLVLLPGGADSFLSRLLPGGGLESRFDLGFGYSSESGFYFRGSSALEVHLPLHLDLGVSELRSMSLGAGLSGDALRVDLGVGVTGQLGPLAAEVEGMGLRASFRLPEDKGGNLGPVDLDLGFKPPEGVGLSLDARGFRGGGFLFFDHENERYAGALEISFRNIVTLKAVGLITTRLPDGSKGFSLLILVTAEFNAVQLGFGFTLLGVGGLFGFNRTTQVDVLRQGIKTNALASVLFPKNILENAQGLISDLRQIFPPKEGKFVFGPMAKIGWGTPTLLSIELGLIIEVPSPVKVVVLGIFRTILPDEKFALIRIQVNFLGAWEQDKQLISFDAGLFDSRILTYPLSGDMAFRLAYGKNANFLVTVGGFHPSYKPEAFDLAGLARVSVQLMGGNNPRLTLLAYLAVTSNTVQLGARLELLAKAWKFNVYGFLAFDALLQFSPFYFIVGISGGLAVRAGTRSLFSIAFDLSLSGPTPWNAKGTAKFKVLFVKVKVRFNKTWGDKRDTSLPDVPVLPLLVEAFEDGRNWEAKLPASSNLLVSLREIDAGESGIVAHPAGTLTARQRVVPLDTTIDRFGSQKPSDANRFRIEAVRSGGTEFDTEAVEESFAPAQFEELDDAQKLSRKSFETMPAGVRIKSRGGEVRSSRVVPRQMRYETIVIDTRRRIQRFGRRLRERLGIFFALLRGNAVARSRVSFVNNQQPVLSPGKIRVRQEGFQLVGIVDLKPMEGTSAFGSEAGARAHLRDLVRKDPALATEFQVVPSYEAQEAA